MTSNTENIMLEILKSMRSDMSKMQNDTHEIKSELISSRHHRIASDSDIARQNESIYLLQERVERIEKRLDFSES